VNHIHAQFRVYVNTFVSDLIRLINSQFIHNFFTNAVNTYHARAHALAVWVILRTFAGYLKH